MMGRLFFFGGGGGGIVKKNNLRGITQEMRKRKHSFIYATHYLDLNHIAIQFHGDISNCYLVMGCTRMTIAQNQNSFVLLLNQNICCVYSKELSRDASFEHQKKLFKWMDNKILTILRSYLLLFSVT